MSFRESRGITSKWVTRVPVAAGVWNGEEAERPSISRLPAVRDADPPGKLNEI